ncbi:MAG: hypothetical protein ABIH99_03750 [Candidatus Micrarchaeota archaeon]
MNLKMLFVFFVSAVLIAGCLGGEETPSSNKTKSNESVEINGTLENETVEVGCAALKGYSRDMCYFSSATANEDASECSKIFNVSIKDVCISKFPYDSLSACTELSAVEKRDECFYAVAVSTNASSLCSSITGNETKTGCVAYFFDPCSGMSNAYELALCKALDANDSEICASVPASDDCYMDYSINKSNVVACSKIQNNVARQACTAAVSNMYSLCDQLTYTEARDACYSTVAVKKNIDSVCALTTTELYKSNCYSALALTNLKPALCYYCSPEVQADECYQAIAEKSLDLEVCKSIRRTANRDTCRINIAKTLSDPSICDYVESSYQKDAACFLNMITLGDYVLKTASCDAIETPKWRDECLRKAAQQQGNASICSLISYEATKNLCERNVGPPSE